MSYLKYNFGIRRSLNLPVLKRNGSRYRGWQDGASARPPLAASLRQADRNRPADDALPKADFRTTRTA
jgi:hypothetical protein